MYFEEPNENVAEAYAVYPRQDVDLAQVYAWNNKPR